MEHGIERTVKGKFRPEVREVGVLLVEVEGFRLHDLAMVPQDIEAGVLGYDPPFFVSRLTQVRKIHYTEGHTSALNLQFHVENEPRIRVCEHERIDFLGGVPPPDPADHRLSFTP